MTHYDNLFSGKQVAGIFLIFIWILVDQLFVQMKTMKQLGMKSMSTTNLSQLRGNMSLSYSSETLRSNKSVYKVRYSCTCTKSRAVMGISDLNQPFQTPNRQSDQRSQGGPGQSQATPGLVIQGCLNISNAKVRICR